MSGGKWIIISLCSFALDYHCRGLLPSQGGKVSARPDPAGPGGRRGASGEWRVASGTEGREMELIEKRQNKAYCSGVCPCQIRTYDEIARGPTRAMAAGGTSEISTFIYRTP